jgi:hypothetical protein
MGRVLLKPRPDVIWDRVDSKMTVCNLATGELLELNKTAEILWKRIVEGMEFDPVEILSSVYPGIDPDRIGSDVDAVLVRLENAGLVG